MNDQDFILLMEEYFDGTLSPDQRAALGSELTANTERRRLFEEQARQHIRLHAQTSRIDFTESQHIAMMVIDIVEKAQDPARFADILHDQTFGERIQAIRKGLRAPKGSGHHRFAQFALLRLFGTPTLSIAVSVTIVLLMVFVWVPKVMRPPPGDDEPTTFNLAPNRSPPVLDVIPPTPPQMEEPDDSRKAVTTTYPPDFPAPIPTPNPEPLANVTEATPIPHPRSGPPVPPRKIPGTLRGRDEPGRADILRRTPNSDRTERAVTNALKWLRDHQLENGSWPGQEPTAMTGLALLVYLAHGEVPGSGCYGETVTGGLKFLLGAQNDRGAFARNVYAHAIATYAVSEAVTLTRIIELRTAMEKAVQVIVQGQQDLGGFDYDYNKSARFDTSVSGWQIQALKAASLAGTGQPALDSALAKSIRFLQTQAFSHDGSGFVYEGQNGVPTTGVAKWTMTGVGTLCLQLLGKPDAVQARLGLKSLRDVAFDWVPGKKPSLYGYYYITQAKFQQDNAAAWQQWNLQMQSAILKNQQSDGHWENGDYDLGSHVYTTTLCTLMLEVYYRYLPTYEKVRGQEGQPKASTEEVIVNVQ